MKQINTINRFLAGLGAAVVLFGATLLAPSGAMAQSKSSTGVKGQKEESGKAVQPKKVKQQSLSNQRPVEKRNVPSAAVDAKTQSSSGVKQTQTANERLNSAEARKQKQKQNNIEKEKAAKEKNAARTNTQSLSNKPAADANLQSGPVAADKANAQADWEKKRERTKGLLLAKGLSAAEVEKKLQEMDKQVQSASKK